VFLLLATANGAGYRYGDSDQAFYVPVVRRAIDPALFPRDRPVIDAEGKLMISDEVLAAASKATGASVEMMFLLGYILSMALMWAALVLIGNRIYGNAWAVMALAAAFTLRHRITLTSANSFEPYFHPRMLSFALGALAVAALLYQRRWLTVALVAVAALAHVTTALWFAVLLGVALAVVDRQMRRLMVVGAVPAVALLAVMATIGPLHGATTTMDDVWLRAVASKDDLFATQWPVTAWAANLGLLALLWWVHRYRMRRGDATNEDAGLVWGCTALVAVFLITLPAVAARFSLIVQFQISRVFWLVDFLALVYLIAVLAGLRGSRARALAGVLIAFSAVRGVYVMAIEHPQASLFDVHVPPSPWIDAMDWLKQQPVTVHVLADPGHAWKYGTSVRVAAERDVFLEEVKDAALAIYSHDIAVRVVDRVNAIGDFTTLDVGRARDLAKRFDLDFLVVDRDLDLPLAYRNSQFRIYSLR
jgi:hypothetical protein